jgi:hypothetical protein
MDMYVLRWAFFPLCRDICGGETKTGWYFSVDHPQSPILGSTDNIALRAYWFKSLGSIRVRKGGTKGKKPGVPQP